MAPLHSYHSIPNAFAELDVSLSRSLLHLNLLLKYMRLAHSVVTYVVSHQQRSSACYYASAVDDYRVRRLVAAGAGEEEGGGLSPGDLQNTKAGEE